MSAQSTYSLSLNGSTGYVDVPDSASLQIGGTNQPITLAAWVYWNGATEAYNHVLGKESVSQGYVLLVRSDGKLAFYLSLPLNGAHIDGTGSAIPTGAWTHIAATFDAVTGLNTYINGVLDVNNPIGALYGGAVGAAFTIGRSLIFGAGRWFNGLVDDCLVMPTALTATQFANIAGNLAVAGSSSLNVGTLTTAGLWRIEAGSGSTIADMSGNGNNGTASGGYSWSSSVALPLQAGGGGIVPCPAAMLMML